MEDISTPSNSEEIYQLIDGILQDIDLEPFEASKIMGYVNRELPHLLRPETTSYFVLGSYEYPYIRRLRIVHNELSRRTGSYPFIMGDLPQIDIDRLPEFRIEFHLLGLSTDYIVGVYEKRGGGEVTELGKITEKPYFEYSHILPRYYRWSEKDQPESKLDILIEAIEMDSENDLNSSRMDKLLEKAEENHIDIDRSEIREVIDQKNLEEDDMPEYSWVQMNEFRQFELHGRCYPWTTEKSLRNQLDNVPRS
ncbi:hypothetical protein ACEU6E_02980 [Halorutilales archaeon Cl-col2-1]